MTNEEAKSIISNIDKAYRTFSKEEIQALEKAIIVLEQESCEDAISKAEVLKIIYIFKENHTRDEKAHPINYGTLLDINRAIRKISSVTPKPKTGHWIGRDASGTNFYGKCSCCGQEIQIDVWYTQNMKYCPNCGAKMESEDKEC